jgi:hypothetical protein
MGELQLASHILCRWQWKIYGERRRRRRRRSSRRRSRRRRENYLPQQTGSAAGQLGSPGNQ